jgi:hypothetical protein
MSLDKLNEAIAKVKSGDKVTGGKILSDYVRENPSNETAWLWLSICVAPVEQKRFCLNKVLSINPSNENARKALEKLDAPPPPAPSLVELSDNQPVSSIETIHKSSPEYVNTTPGKELNRLKLIAVFMGFGGLLLIVISILTQTGFCAAIGAISMFLSLFVFFASRFYD